MSASRFKQFVISDSDEDSGDEAVMDRREKRSGTDNGSNAQYPTEEAAYPTEERVPLAEAAARAIEKTASMTPRTPATANAHREMEAPEETNQSSLSFRIEGATSRNVTDGNSPQALLTEGQSIKFESVPATPGKPEMGMDTPFVPQSRASEISFRSAPRSPKTPAAFRGSKPGTPRSVGAAPPVPLARGAGSTTAPSAPPPDSTRASTPRYALEDGGSNQPSPQELETPKEGSEHDGEKKKKKVVRKRVVTKRKKGGDPSALAEVISEEIIAPQRTASPAPPAPLGAPPPPSRVSPRAQRAASSRANTPRSGSAEAGPRPRTPASRADSPVASRVGVVERKVAPLIPGRTPTVGATPRSVRTPLDSARSSIVVLEDEGTADKASAKASMKGSIKGSVKSGRSTPERKSANDETGSIQFHSPLSAGGGKSPGTFDFQVEGEDTTSISFQVATTTSHEQPSMPRAHAPDIPSASALATPRSTYEMDDEGNVVRVEPARVRRQVKPDGSVVWVFVGQHRDDALPEFTREIAAPPKKLSQRAQDIMAAKRRAVEQSAKKRHTAPKSARKPRQRFNFAPTSYYSKSMLQRHVAAALAAENTEWTVHRYDSQPSCQHTLSDRAIKDAREDAEQVIRAIQPIQVGGTGSGTASARCSCVEYVSDKEAELGKMLRDEAMLEEGFKRYLNLQPMQLANVELNDLTDPSGGETPAASRRPSVSQTQGSGSGEGKTNPDRGLATLGGLWCTVEALREDGRPATRKDAKPPRRVMRVCGGPALGLPLKEEGQSLDVRCYELLLFPQESLSPAAVNYGAEGLTLGQLISPPASSFPLTPRIVDDPIQLKEYKKKLLATKSRAVAIQNSEDDRLTMHGPGATASITGTPTGAAGDASTVASTPKAGAGPAGAAVPTSRGTPCKYLTITLVTLNSRQRYTIDLTLVMLPYRTNNVDGGKTLAEVPRFCPFTVATNRRLQGLSLSFSTRSSFMSAYRSLLWATECNIIDIQPTAPVAGSGAGAGVPYMNLRVSATPCPLLPWSSSMGVVRPDVAAADTFHGNCVDFAVITLSASPTFTDSAEPGYRDPLTLDDFVIEEYNGDKKDGAGDKDDESKSRQITNRRSSIYTSTLVASDANGRPAANSDATTVVGLTSFGVIRRAVNQKTSEVFDVRVIPRNRARMCPTFDEESHTIKTAKMEEEQLLQQDVEAAIIMEYTSRLPFQSRVYGVLVDEQRYYVFQEPWISALALEQSAAGSAERKALEYNPTLKSISDRTSVMSLKEFIHGVLRPETDGDAKEALGAPEEARLQIAQTLISQLLMLITSIHGKGMLLGPCPPHRLVVRVETPPSARRGDEEGEETTKLGSSEEPTPIKGAGKGGADAAVTSKNVQLCVLDLGVNTYAWSYERQQCGVLEYVSPSYAFEYMLGEDIGKESRAWSMRDDWWTFLCISFELLAADGSALVKPKEDPMVPTPTPIISKFSSPADILNIWKEVLTNKDITGNTVNETVAARVQAFVRSRVLESVSPMLDSWIANKADELEFFGTTASGAGTKHRKNSARAVLPADGAPSKKMIGVSLASMYFQSNRNVSPAESDTSEIKFFDDGEAPSGPNENILKEMPWMFHYREFFDSVIDVVYPHEGDAKCAVHGPSAHLLSHPFFTTVNLGQIFDGTHPMPRAAAQAIRTHMTKNKVKDALLKYRTRTYRGPIPKRPEYPLMITSSAFNMGSNNGAAPLLLLTSPAYRDELSAREMDPDAPWTGQDFQEGLVSSPAHTTIASAVPSPRARSPGMVVARAPGQQAQPQAVPWAQQGRLKVMYKEDELQSIAQLENEVRGALYSHTARDSVSRREMDIPPTTTHDTPRQHTAGAEAPPMSLTNDGSAAPVSQPPAPPSVGPVRTTSATSTASSHRRRDPSAYKPVSAHSSVMAPTVDELRSDNVPASTTSNHSAPAPYQQMTTNPYVNINSVGPISGSVGSGTPNRGGTPRSRATPGSARNQRPEDVASNKGPGYNLDFNEIERSLNELAAGPKRDSRAASNVSGKPGSASQSGRWPNEFLGAAHLDKKGTPLKLSDPLLAGPGSERPSTPHGNNTPRKANSVRSGGNVVVAKEPSRRPTDQRRPASRSRNLGSVSNHGEDESIVLVPSDDDESGVFVPRQVSNHSGARGGGSTYQSSAAGRNTPTRKKSIPAWRRTAADNRDSYFEF